MEPFAVAVAEAEGIMLVAQAAGEGIPQLLATDEFKLSG